MVQEPPKAFRESMSEYCSSSDCLGSRPLVPVRSQLKDSWCFPCNSLSWRGQTAHDDLAECSVLSHDDSTALLVQVWPLQMTKDKLHVSGEGIPAVGWTDLGLTSCGAQPLTGSSFTMQASCQPQSSGFPAFAGDLTAPPQMIFKSEIRRPVLQRGRLRLQSPSDWWYITVEWPLESARPGLEEQICYFLALCFWKWYFVSRFLLCKPQKRRELSLWFVRRIT